MQNKTSQNIIGPDLNEYRGAVNYTLLATKTPYSYLRGSGHGSGRFRADKKFIEYVQGLKNVGIKTGAYHYAVPSYDLNTADAQCDGFIDILQQAYGQGKYGDLFPVIDIEAPIDKSISTDALLDWVDRFRKRFEKKTRRKMMLYTGAFFIELYNNFYHTKKGFILSDMPLWIAMYPDIQPNPPYPKDQGGWTRWRMWQFTESGTMAGVNPPVDLNYGPTTLDLLTQPRNVKNFKAVASGQGIKSTWTANTDEDLAGYNIFLNSNYITTLGKHATSYTMPLANKPVHGERYEVSIEAFDADGDFSEERAKSIVVFNRSDLNYSSEDNKPNYVVENITEKDELDTSLKKEKFIDPVDLLEKRFSEPWIEKYSQETSENQENNKISYRDFVECEDEFDDILYMKIIENEKAYRKYYQGDKEYKRNFYDTNEEIDWPSRDNCDCDNCENYVKEWNENDQSHYDDKESKKNDKDNKKDKNHDEHGEEKENKDKDKCNKYEYKPYEKKCEPANKEKSREEYEGERRRLENHDNKKSKKCDSCIQDKENCVKCEYFMQDIYLNNCDYGHKKSKDKKKSNKHHNHNYKCNTNNECNKGSKSKKHHHH